MIEYKMHCGSDNTIANTARVSMEVNGNWADLPEGYETWARDKLLKYLAEHKHTSPFRHSSITVQCKVPLFLARQLGKHQVGMSWNETSRRYTTDGLEFWMPDAWRCAPDKNIKQGSGVDMSAASQVFLDDVYKNVLDVCEGAYQTALLEGCAPEQARMMLPQSMQIPYVWTGSLMAFAHVYNLRIDGHSQKEARDFAEQLDNIIEPLFPVSWKVLTGRT